MSAIIIGLDNHPASDPAKVKKDKDLNDKIITEIKGDSHFLTNVFGMSYFDLWLIECLVAYLSTENAERNSLDEFSELLQEKAFIKECPTIGGIKTLIAKRGFIARNFDEARAKNE